jgi:hypothetical protein
VVQRIGTLPETCLQRPEQISAQSLRLLKTGALLLCQQLFQHRQAK